MSETSLVYYDNAKKALALVHRVDEVKDIRDKAEAMQVYARQADDPDLINYATEIRMRAEKRAGELLAKMAERGERAKPGDEESGRGKKPLSRPTLSKLGVTKAQSSRWQRFAALSEDEQEERIATAKKVAVAVTEGNQEIVKAARAQRRDEKHARRRQHEAELGAKIVAMPDKKCGVIVCDDAWDAVEESHTVDELHEATKDRFACAADDCLLAMWSTVPHLAIAIDLLRKRGFRYVSHYVWAKDKAGTGYWNRNKHEILLLGVKGNIPCPAPGQQWVSFQIGPVTGHSAKPEFFLQMLEEQFPHLPKIELNRRGKPRAGWASHEVSPMKEAVS